MKRKTIIFLILSLFTVICAAAIFIFSSQNADTSNDLSRKITIKIAKILFIDMDNFDSQLRETIITQLNMSVRKAAHFIVYFIMGAAAFGTLSVISRKYLRNGIISVFLSACYAFTDEIHQSFIPGRTALEKDIIIDTFGAVLGTVFCFMIICTVSHIILMRKNNSSPPSAS